MTPAETLAIQLAAAPPYRIDWARLPENGGGTAWAVDRVYFRNEATQILAALAAAGFVVVPGVATAEDRMRQAIEWARAMSEEPDDFPALLASCGEAMLAARAR